MCQLARDLKPKDEHKSGQFGSGYCAKLALCEKEPSELVWIVGINSGYHFLVAW